MYPGIPADERPLIGACERLLAAALMTLRFDHYIDTSTAMASEHSQGAHPHSGDGRIGQLARLQGDTYVYSFEISVLRIFGSAIICRQSQTSREK